MPSGTTIAIKMINRANLTADTQNYLNSEIKIMSSLKNEYIVTLYDV